MKKEYSIIIDTNQYTGNFERELCAFVTGQIGDCKVGEKFIDPDEDYELFDDDIIRQDLDNDGCFRPVRICQDVNGKINSIKIFFENKPTDEQINFIKNKTLKFKCGRIPTKIPIEIIGFRLCTKIIEHKYRNL
jgi:hypothetical protein